jgi:hypothetical protein
MTADVKSDVVAEPEWPFTTRESNKLTLRTSHVICFNFAFVNYIENRTCDVVCDLIKSFNEKLSK